MSTSERRLREQICQAGQIFRQQGLIVGCEGNISCQLDSGDILITPAGKDKAGLTSEMLVRLSAAGQVRDGELEPSSEWRLHLAAYNTSTEINAAVHLHPPYATAFAVAEQSLPVERLSEAQTIFGSIPLVEYAPPGSEQLASGVAKQLPENQTLLLARHGLISFGADLMQACEQIRVAEHCAQILWLAESLRRPPTEDN